MLAQVGHKGCNGGKHRDIIGKINMVGKWGKRAGDDMKTRQARNRLAKAYQLRNRGFKPGARDNLETLQLVKKCGFEAEPWPTWDAVVHLIKDTQDEIAEREENTRRARISTWKEDMQDMKKVGRWLRRKQLAPRSSTAITYRQETATNINQVLDFIGKHWEDIDGDCLHGQPLEAARERIIKDFNDGYDVGGTLTRQREGETDEEHFRRAAPESSTPARRRGVEPGGPTSGLPSSSETSPCLRGRSLEG